VVGSKETRSWCGKIDGSGIVDDVGLMPLFLPTGLFGRCHNVIMYLNVELAMIRLLLKSTGPCAVRTFLYISNKMQRYTVYFLMTG